jgi:hypothetical protein
MTRHIISVALYCLFIPGLVINSGCATKMDTRKLPDNIEFGPANKQGYKQILAIAYSHPLPQMTDSEYLGRMIECVDKSVFYEKIIRKNGSIIMIRKDAGSTYTGEKKSLIDSSNVLIGAYPGNNNVRAAGITTFPVGPAMAIVRFSLTVNTGKSNDYILEFHSIEVGLKELLHKKGFIRATNNATQHPERTYEKTRLMSEAIDTCMTTTQG